MDLTESISEMVFSKSKLRQGYNRNESGYRAHRGKSGQAIDSRDTWKAMHARLGGWD